MRGVIAASLARRGALAMLYEIEDVALDILHAS